MTDEIDKVERSYIPLASEFDAYVLVNHDAMVCPARIVGVEINGEDTKDDRLVAIVSLSDGRMFPHRVEEAYSDEKSANRLRTYRIHNPSDYRHVAGRYRHITESIVRERERAAA